MYTKKYSNIETSVSFCATGIYSKNVKCMVLSDMKMNSITIDKMDYFIRWRLKHCVLYMKYQFTTKIY